MNAQKIIGLALLIVLPTITNVSHAQIDESYQPILWTERYMSAAKLMSSELVDKRFLLIAIRGMNTERDTRNRIRTDDVYAFDCAKPRKLKVIFLRINQAKGEVEQDNWINARSDDVPESFKIQDLDYMQIEDWTKKADQALQSAGIISNLPDTLIAAAEYGCSAILVSPEKRIDIGDKISRSGAQSDVQELVCEYSLDKEKTYTANVGFSESKKTVRWNDRWMQGAYVKERGLGISGEKMSAAIDRQTGAIRVTFSSITAKGTCEVAKSVPKKF